MPSPLRLPRLLPRRPRPPPGWLLPLPMLSSPGGPFRVRRSGRARRLGGAEEPLHPRFVLRPLGRAHRELVLDPAYEPRVAACSPEPCQPQRLQGLPIVGLGAVILHLKLVQIGARPLGGAPALPRRVRL